ESLRVPVHGVCTLDIIAWESGRTAPFAVATDARRKEVYWARYDSARARATGPAVGPPADVPADLPVLGEGAALYPDAPGRPGHPAPRKTVPPRCAPAPGRPPRAPGPPSSGGAGPCPPPPPGPRGCPGAGRPPPPAPATTWSPKTPAAPSSATPASPPPV